MYIIILVSNIIEYTFYVVNCCIIPHLSNPLTHAAHVLFS